MERGTEPDINPFTQNESIELFEIVVVHDGEVVTHDGEVVVCI